MSNLEICYMSVTDMAEAIRTRRLSPVEILGALLSRIERLNPKVNAYCTVAAESARRQAVAAEKMVMKGEKLGPLHGVPVSIKDVIFTGGIRTTGGSRVFENFVPREDAIVVERLKAARAIVIGKTNTPEFADSPITGNLLFGLTKNPWNLKLTPGGSSGGAAAAVASGMGSLAIGNDAGGSIRIPSSFCGVFGLKPSFGRVPQYPSFFPGNYWETTWCTGPITRTVRDAALTMEIIAGRDDRDRWTLPDRELRYLPFLGSDLKGLKIAWCKNFGPTAANSEEHPHTIVDHRVLEVTERAVKIFDILGARVEEANPEAKIPSWESFSTHLSDVMMSTLLQEKSKEWRDQVGRYTLRDIDRRGDRPAIAYARAYLEQLQYWEDLRPFFEKYDLLLTPTVAVPPFELGKFAVTEIDGIKVSAWGLFAYPFNITGQPAASVPCGWTDDGLPIGLQIVGRRFDDVTVLRAAAAFEEASPWIARRPPLD